MLLKKIDNILEYVEIMVVCLLMGLAVLGILMFFANLFNLPVPLVITSDEFKHLIGDVLLIMAMVELAKTIIIYIVDETFYIQGIVSAVLVVVCRNIILIKFNGTISDIITASAAAILILVLLAVLKFMPITKPSKLRENLMEFYIEMDNKPGVLAEVSKHLGDRNINIISGNLTTINEDLASWNILVDCRSTQDISQIKKELKSLDPVKKVKISKCRE